MLIFNNDTPDEEEEICDHQAAMVMAAMEKEAQQEGPTSGILQEIRENIEPEAEEPMEEAPQQEQPKGIMSRGAV